MKKTSAFSPTRVSMAVAVVCVGISMPAFAQMETKLTGRVHYDFRGINNDLSDSTDRDTASIANNFELRRARIGFTGSLNKDLQFEAVGNAVGGSTNFIDTAFINYGYNKQGQIRLGRFKQPFSIEENTSSNNIDFLERSYVNQMAPGKKLGAMLHGFSDQGFTYAASIYSNDFSELSNSNTAGGMAALRGTANLAKLAEISGDSTIIHLGAGYNAGSYQQTPTSSGNTTGNAVDTRSTVVSFRDENRGLSNAYRLQIGGDIMPNQVYGQSADNVATIKQNMIAVELAVAQGPFKFQSEYAKSKLDARALNCTWSGNVCTSFGTANVGASVETQYVSAVWNITGENFAPTYSRGSWGSIKPANEFMKDYGGVVGNGRGAWQLTYRYSTYDVVLDQAATYAAGTVNAPEYTITDGTTRVTKKSRYQNSPKAVTNTVGVNWILHSNARVMFNYSDTKFDQTVKTLDTNNNASTTSGEQIFSVRTQVNF
jgi:phosphate-selective porin OprO/OprP